MRSLASLIWFLKSAFLKRNAFFSSVFKMHAFKKCIAFFLRRKKTQIIKGPPEGL